MRLVLKILFFVVLTIFAVSCKKTTEKIVPNISILSPESKQLFTLPDTVKVVFNVSHTSDIKYIRVSIDNKNIIPVSGQIFIEPDSNIYNGTVLLPINHLITKDLQPPYYVHIVVDNYSQESSAFREIELRNADNHTSGYIIISKSNIDKINVNYFNDTFDFESSVAMDGNFRDSDISSSSEIICITTTIPDKAIALNSIVGNVIWENNPQLPYPKFNKVLIDNNITYISTRIGRIIGIDNIGGNQIFSTPVLPDSIPNNICVTNNYLFSDFSLRNGNSTLWTVFYKQTGAKYKVILNQVSTLSMYSIDNKDDIICFANTETAGQILYFSFSDNDFTIIKFVDDTIVKTCKISNNTFLYTSGSGLWQYSYNNNSVTKLIDIDDSLVEIKYNSVTDEILLVYPSKIMIYSFPDMLHIKNIELESAISAVEIKYDY